MKKFIKKLKKIMSEYNSFKDDNIDVIDEITVHLRFYNYIEGVDIREIDKICRDLNFSYYIDTGLDKNLNPILLISFFKKTN